MPSSSDPADQLRAHFREGSPIGPHPAPEQIVAYHEHRLPAEEMESLRAHLVACPDCAAQLVELAALVEGDDAPGPEMSRAELDAAWQRQRGKLFPGSPLSFPDRRTHDAPPRLRRAWAAAASLGLAAALLAVVVAVQWRTIVRLERPQVNPPLVNLRLEGSVRQGNQKIRELHLTPEVERAWVILNPDGELDYPSYDAEIRSADGEVVLRLADLRSSEAGNFRLEIPRALLPEGEYRIVLLGKKGGQRRIVGEFELRVRSSATIGAS
jgi:anti-sigma factor RsiW